MPEETPVRRRGLRSLSAAHDPLTSLVLTLPVFLTYHLGILLIDIRNGVDLVTGLMLKLLDYSVLAYIGLTLALSLGLVASGSWLRKRNKVRLEEFVPVLVESLVLAFGMLLLVGWMTQQILPGQIGGLAMGPVEKLVMACGAGFHEELVFRVALFGGGIELLRRKGQGVGRALLISAFASSLLFSAFHYVGEMSDDFEFVSFTFRFLAGLYLAAVFRLRGFAVAVYTHTLYDLLVFFVLL